MNTERKTSGIGIRIVLTLIILLLVSAVVLYVARFREPDTWHETVLSNTTQIVDIISRM
jgi:hypothetical protein